ncbi:type VII secretion integral membrane protein EccD [Mycobacterium sp. 1245801.1]|uniref:type VII secretion integral membrane protein EccD n=1 Tax=Mycobacterium sp. 1245801.1 TaxID=1834075 RepID=UPI0007FE3902|nr:type VII secretion integral membrane protein EccD [Mycobacterium sp. 1245801.1]OBJ19709.1 type VII secretion integral membrane protein EccD [Mycobacterium sp. 1245801.1]
MTLPPSLSELDSESTDEHDLGRITVVVGGLLIDVAVPTGVATSAIVNDVIELANDQLLVQAGVDVKIDNSEGKWIFTRLTGDHIDPGRSLAEAGVHDGELLVVGKAGAPASSSLADNLEDMPSPGDHRWRWFAEQLWRSGWFATGIVLSAAAALLLPRVAPVAGFAGTPAAAVSALLVGVGYAVGAFVISFRSGDACKAAWLAVTALPLIFGGSLDALPAAYGVNALPMAMSVTALVALLQLLGSARGRTLYTAVIAAAVLGVPALLAQLLLHPNPRSVGAILATVAVVVVYVAPRATILVSGLPVPRVPTAGEPLDDIETQIGNAVEGVNAVGKQVIPTEEGMVEQVRRAREYLTGLVGAAAVLAVVGCYFAAGVADEFFWQGAAFGFVVATVLCLRGRSHHDLVQSAVLIVAGLVIALAVILKTATFVKDWQTNAAVMLVVLTALLVVCGLIAPGREFSPVMRRRVEVFEYIAIGLIFPLVCWIVRLYAFFREMRI